MPLRAPGFRRLPVPILISFAVLVLMVLASLWLALRAGENARALASAWSYRRAVTDVALAVRDAESGQRGYLLTRDPAYLTPYRGALARTEAGLARMVREEQARGEKVTAALHPLIAEQFEELQRTIALADGGRRRGADALVQSGRGRYLMDRIIAITQAERDWSFNVATRVSNDSRVVAGQLTWGLLAGAVLIVVLLLMWVRQARVQFVAVDEARAEAEAALAAARTENQGRQRAEEQVRQLQKMESLGQLTGGIAHDFNNMLAVVLGGIELAKRRLRSDPDKADTLLDNAREGATRAATLTARLLAFSRNSPLAPAPLDVNKLIGGMSDMLHRTLGEAIRVECVYGAGLWRCYADPNEVENAVLNLCINARDAMPAGGKLTVETTNAHIDDAYARQRSDVTAGQYVLICVSDTGTGMTPEVLERAFDPFFTTKAVGKGTGLGLSQVFGFAKQSGGHVAIYSEVDQGTCVKLYLPRFAGSDAAFPVSDEDTMPEARPGEIILVVEDEARVRHFAVDALRELGYTAVSAESPAEALQALDEQPEISMLFTDIVMPEMTGRQLAEAVLALRPGLPILYTTGYTRNAVIHGGLLDVGIAFLAKPYGMSELARKVRDVLDGRGANRPI